jgi:hypothetical protein
MRPFRFSVILLAGLLVACGPGNDRRPEKDETFATPDTRPFLLNDADRSPTVTPDLQRAVHTLEDIAGRSWGSLEDPELGRWSTLVFVRSDCPISNQYAPEIRRIHADYAINGVEFFLVYIDRHLTEEAVREHLEEFGHTLPAILDSDHVLVDKAGATITPEVAIFSEGAELEYRGRINNLYPTLGRPRRQVTEHDLRNALDDLVQGRPVRTPVTQATGCYIE